jgi:hypothetical protein
MSKILKVSNGDYRVQVQSGGSIIFDTAPSTQSVTSIVSSRTYSIVSIGDTDFTLYGATSNTVGLSFIATSTPLTGTGTVSRIGAVTVIGDLNVRGNMTTVETTNTKVQDNILQLNNGQTGNGISSVLGYQSGIQIERGNYSPAQFVFNEQVTHYDPINSVTVTGTFVMKTADGNLSGLQVGSISNSGTSNFVFDLQNSGYTLRIANSGTYEALVINANDIPNRKFVTDYVSATGGQANVVEIHYPQVGTPVQSQVATTTNSVDFKVINPLNQVLTLRATINTSGLTVNNVNLLDNSVTNVSGSNDLILTSANNNVSVNSILNIQNQGSDITTPIAGATRMYTKASEGPGRTGIYFTNNTAYGGIAYNNDELVSRNRAVLLSILL